MNYLEKIKAMRQEAKSKETTYFKNTYAKSMRLSDLKEGKTIIRVAPGKPIPYVPFRSTYLEVELNLDQLQRYHYSDIIKDHSLLKKLGVDKESELSEMSDDDLKAKLKSLLSEGFTKKVNKRVFISTVHGKPGQNRDLIEEYIKFVVQKVNDEVGDRDESKKQLAPIFGAKINGNWTPGINPSTNFVFHCWDWDAKTFHKFEIYSKQMDRIEELYLPFDDPESPLTTDPFSDPEKGVGLEFYKVKNDKGKWDYKIENVQFNGKKFNTYTDFVEQYKLSEAQIQEFKDVPSLEESLGQGSFKKKDFEVQLNGLLLFDEKHGYNAFQNDEFCDLVEELGTQFEGEEEVTEEEQAIKDAKSGKDIDKVFEQKPLKVQEQEEVVEDDEEQDDEESEALKKAMALIAKNKAKKAKVVDTSNEVKENSFKEEVVDTTPPKALNDKLAAMRKNLNKGK